MNHFHYYHILSYIEDYHDITTFICINHRCQQSVSTLPYYHYKQPHPQMIFPSLVNVAFDFPISTLFLQELTYKASNLFSLSFVINKINIKPFISTDKTLQIFQTKLLNQLKGINISLKINSNTNLFLAKSILKFTSLSFTYDSSINLTTINSNIKELDITLNQYTPIIPFQSFLNKFLLKKLIIRIEYECQWNFIRSLAKLVKSINATGLIYVSNKVIYESGEIDDLLINIPQNICIIFNDGYIGCNGFSGRFGKYEEDNIIQRDGDSSVIIPIPLPEITLDHTSYTTQLKTIDLSQKTWISSVETSYNLNYIKLPTSIISLKLYNPPSSLPMNLVQLHMENINNSMVNLSCAAFNKLILKKCNIETLQVPSTLTFFSSTYNTFLKVGLNCQMKEANFNSCQLPMLLIPTTCTYLNVYCSRLPFVQLTCLKQLQVYNSDFSKLATTTRLSQLTGLTFISKTEPEFTSLNELPILKYSNALVQCNLQHVCFSKFIAPGLKQLTIDFVQPVLISENNNKSLLTPSDTNEDTLPSVPEKSSVLVSPSFIVPCLRECYLKGILSLQSPIDSWRIYIDGCNDIILGATNGVHLKNCHGKINFNNEKNASVISSLSLYNCFFDNNSFQKLKAVQHLRIYITGNFKVSEWRYQSFNQLSDILLSAKSINLGSIVIPSSVTSLSITSEKKKGKLAQTTINQLKILSLN
ncbi:hypothetical protein EHI8A_027850 [Entamoeba histolytica HM-1:IMSS-B]|uniref:Uncharacterized protein n=6 Tax=Entamoeba histolytica TaxID=5759 RepID=C4M0S3_ENTH1|nr:hypothetical protein EHI_010090 [Entamoeba histolytica HM-1:IMSS]EMD45346.1 Hypothetical protein EHI5A_050680 [Entamoeba histolytica KU27]EMH77552.1 hypothetical protein EHI8A_027850 [Entamoeba histolytica HM-1:IMSS-B]EMS14670.1 hypothetical protein KM1_063280 [Entamoeba histolytica HM-3:IMSS]ENY61106.1 hypothetical protein EHI7A_030970 [Entamoeba histolytica HM-1:IMSS-A]GAT94773.1 hypothetical protein CL6EHI_010090 [Entamoeba histolytica]|eukprot:XP_657087.1 hypothetical protein EHI_010090 [Entamoeba histolytica HM-1:IMSS]